MLSMGTKWRQVYREIYCWNGVALDSPSTFVGGHYTVLHVSAQIRVADSLLKCPQAPTLLDVLATLY